MRQCSGFENLKSANKSRRKKNDERHFFGFLTNTNRVSPLFATALLEFKCVSL